jgi:hypothetical protein
MHNAHSDLNFCWLHIVYQRTTDAISTFHPNECTSDHGLLHPFKVHGTVVNGLRGIKLCCWSFFFILFWRRIQSSWNTQVCYGCATISLGIHECNLSWIRSSNSLVIDTEFTPAINSAYGGISKKVGVHKRRFRILIEDLILIIFLKSWEKLQFYETIYHSR